MNTTGKQQHGMKNTWLGLGGLLVATLFFAILISLWQDASGPEQKPAAMPFLANNQALVTSNTTRIGSDDPVETAVAVAQIIYPVTEEEDSPGAVILINRNNLAEGLVAASRVQHFPVNAPLLYVEEDHIPELTRQELLRLQPEGVTADGNVQVYLVGTISQALQRQVEDLGFKTRALRASDPAELAEVVDDWTSTQHGDHANELAIANLDHLEPAISSAFWNAHMGQGLAFVTDQGIPEATRRMLQRRANGPWLYLFGDDSVIPEQVARELAAYGQVTRMPRPDASSTSVYFAGFKDIGKDWGGWFWQNARDFGWGISEAGHNLIFVRLDGPGGWQNALPATTLSHMGKHAPVIILDGDQVSEQVANYIKILRPYPTAPQQQLLDHGWIIGGEGTISWQTQTELDSQLEAFRRNQQETTSQPATKGAGQ